jgi:hypothetical protein
MTECQGLRSKLRSPEVRHSTFNANNLGTPQCQFNGVGAF